MELSIEPSCQYVTWKVRDFLQLPSDDGYCLDSPEFPFGGDSYRLQLYPTVSDERGVSINLQLSKVTSTVPERRVSCTVGYRRRGKKGSKVDTYLRSYALNTNFRLRRQLITDRIDSDGTFTVLCSMRQEQQSNPGSQQSEEVEISDARKREKGLPGQSVFFSSHSWFFKMELSIESPYQHVRWKIPDFFQLLSKFGYSLNSPEFRFAGDRYCLRFYPKGDRNADKAHTDLQLVRLTTSFPERIVLYKAGCMRRISYGTELDDYTYSGTLIDEFGFCLSLSDIDDDKNLFVRDGNLTVLCSVRLKEHHSAGSPQSEEAGNSHAEEKQEGLPAGNVIAHHFDKTTVPDSVSCAIQTKDASSMIDKENIEDLSFDTKDDALLREGMKKLLTKGSDHDVTICVQDKKFRAHRTILSARSPVFAMMLSHDTKENNTGTISIEDCDPESFDEFLLYVYTGRTENLSPSNALQLYYSADKYNFPILKERCVSVLKASLSIMSLCDVVLLAAKHQEKELLEVATEFFARNIKEIIVTVGWQNFLSQNPVEANEIYIKSMEILLPEN